MAHHDDNLSPLDAATARRLARLGEQPVDVSDLQRRLEQQLAAPPAAATTPATFPLWRRWLSPGLGLAASILLALVVLFAVVEPAPPVHATPVVQLTQLHHDLLEGRIPVTPVESIEQANTWIAQQSTSAPALPQHMDHARVQSCCLANVQGDVVAIAVVRHGTTPITLVVADAPDFAHRMGRIIDRDGQEMFAHAVGGVQMVMTRAGDRWLCVMGDVNADTLADLAADVRFGE